MSQPTSFRNVPGQGSLDFPLKGCDLLVVHAVSIKTATVGGGNPAQIPEEQPHAIAATHFPPVFQHKDTHATWQRPSTISIQTCNMASHMAPGSHQLGGFPYSETNQLFLDVSWACVHCFPWLRRPPCPGLHNCSLCWAPSSRRQSWFTNNSEPWWKNIVIRGPFLYYHTILFLRQNLL